MKEFHSLNVGDLVYSKIYKDLFMITEVASGGAIKAIILKSPDLPRREGKKTTMTWHYYDMFCEFVG